MASSALLKLVCAVLVCMVVAAPHVEALTCDQVFGYLKLCLPYLRKGYGPSGDCCAGAKALKARCNTKDLRQSACNCLKALAASTPGVQEKYAESLSSKCGIPLPYKVSPKTDCSRVS